MSEHRANCLALALGACAVSASLPGCGPFESPYAWSDDFEGPLCAGAPCGWSRVAGPADGARWGETLPGEHGLILSGEGVTVLVEPELDLGGFSDFGVALDVIARGDLGAALSVEMAATESRLGTIRSLTPAIVTRTLWSQGRANATRLGGSGDSLRSLDAITFAKSGAGVCEINFVGVLTDAF